MGWVLSRPTVFHCTAQPYLVAENEDHLSLMATTFTSRIPRTLGHGLHGLMFEFVLSLVEMAEMHPSQSVKSSHPNRPCRWIFGHQKLALQWHTWRTARIDLGKIYNATDIEVYFGWRAQAQKPTGRCRYWCYWLYCTCRAQVVYLSMSEDGAGHPSSVPMCFGVKSMRWWIQESEIPWCIADRSFLRPISCMSIVCAFSESSFCGSLQVSPLLMEFADDHTFR